MAVYESEYPLDPVSLNVKVETTRDWLPKLGWSLIVLFFLLFVVGVGHRARLEKSSGQVIRMLFVPSVEQGTLTRRGNELADFVHRDAGLIIRSAVPTSYAAVIQALGAGQADIVWVPVFAYAVAHSRFGAQARLQVVRQAERYGIAVARMGETEPANLSQLSGKRIAFSKEFSSDLRKVMIKRLETEAPGFVEVPAASNKEAITMLLDREEISAALSTQVFSGPRDLVGDGRKELEHDRPGSLEKSRVIFKTEKPVSELVTSYFGAVYTSADSGVERLDDLNGRPFAFSDATSTSGYVFPLSLLKKHNVRTGHVYFAGGHPNAIQAVLDGKVAGGAAFYSPPGKVNETERTFVADARHLLMKRLPEDERLGFLEKVRVIALTDPVPNDFCCTRKGFPKALWDRFEASLQRFIATPEGAVAYMDLVTAVAARNCDDSVLEGYRTALANAGMSATAIMEAEEAKLKKKRESKKETK